VESVSPDVTIVKVATPPIFSLTMATISATHDLHTVSIGARKNRTLTRFGDAKKRLADWWFNSDFTFLLCCVQPEEYDNVLADERVRADIRREMVRTLDYEGSSGGVEAAMRSVRQELSYELCVKQPVTEVVAVAAVCEGTGVETPVEGVKVVQGVEQPRVCVVPRFAAAVTLHLRSRLGRMGPSEANELLLEREYHRVCRKYGVRDADIAAHMSHVKNAYFGEDVFDRVPTGRSRMSRFTRWAMDVKPMPACAPRAC